ncbi:extracellular calcium-sensing receptor-like [Polypterus senegalus]|uniref:extracellular calcium-sensing receptor-like n=1 Tax=Polypterus senegalus TaxID=55291 RepID=UPI001962C2CF|nr:extracellular calcium-sensing receptor-like [Polypterus senegalus]
MAAGEKEKMLVISLGKQMAVHLYLWLTLHLLFHTSVYQADESDCSLYEYPVLPRLFKKGDLMLGGLFPVHFRSAVPERSLKDKVKPLKCEGFDFRAFRWLQSMIFAIEEINNNTNILPNITLGYSIFDTCSTHINALGSAITLATGDEKKVSGPTCGNAPHVPVIIGDASSTSSMVIARTLGVFRIPMVSYFASCACLSNKNEFPSFFRTVPSDNFQAKAMAGLLKQFGWTWVGLISGDDDYGKFGIQIFKEEIQHFDVCIAFFEIIPKMYSKQKIMNIVETIKHSSAKVIVTFAIEADAYSLLQEIVHQNISDKQWIATEAWITSSLVSSQENHQFLAGTIGFAIRKAEIVGLKEFLCRIHPDVNASDPFIIEFWEALFGCTLQVSSDDTSLVTSLGSKSMCTGLENLNDIRSIYNDVSQLRATYNVYKAVYAIAYSFHNMLFCKPGTSFFKNGDCPDIFNLQSWQLTHYLKEVKFKSPVGEFFSFDNNADPIAAYDIINWQRNADGSIAFVKVGQFDATWNSGNEFEINEEKIVWAEGQTKVPKSMCSESCSPGTRKAAREGQPICCFDCLPCADGEISNTTDSLECLKCPEDYWSNTHKTNCILKEIEYLSYGETMGVVLTIMSISGASITLFVITVFLYYKDTAIVKANNSELSFLLLFSLTLCFLCSLTFIGQPLSWSCMLRHTAFGISFVLCISCVLGKTIVVLMAFRATLPGKNIMKYFGPLQQRVGIFLCTLVQILICMLWLILSPPFPTKTSHYSGRVILECNVGSVFGFYSVLGYIGFLACMCFFLAFLGRKLPDNFNEAKFITFSMLIFCAVWITFIPAYVSSPGKYTVAVEIFAIWSSSFSLLVCIFAPKCYIILVRPEKNTKKHLMGKPAAS